ncbi:hypothetical protein GQ53DRAFT_425880 [Thozetella sp. PMI_491]|nr:hypothetical protein GQ53DRAFT_425880 [Thozetella sp. PMI_491]
MHTLHRHPTPPAQSRLLASSKTQASTAAGSFHLRSLALVASGMGGCMGCRAAGTCPELAARRWPSPPGPRSFVPSPWQAMGQSPVSSLSPSPTPSPPSPKARVTWSSSQHASRHRDLPSVGRPGKLFVTKMSRRGWCTKTAQPLTSPACIPCLFLSQATRQCAWNRKKRRGRIPRSAMSGTAL